MRGIKLKDPEILEAIVFFLNSIVFLGLGVTILRISDVASIHINRIKAVAPNYAVYVDYGYIVGFLLLMFSVVQMLFAALKLYEFRAKRKVEILMRMKEVSEGAA